MCWSCSADVCGCLLRPDPNEAIQLAAGIPPARYDSMEVRLRSALSMFEFIIIPLGFSGAS